MSKKPFRKRFAKKGASQKPKAKTVHRPWGSFTEYATNKKCTVKILTVKPKEELSLQSHKLRDEFWVCLDGAPYVQQNKKISRAKPGQTFFIPRGTKHRIFGGKKGGKILEISFGKFREHDEVRYEDKYGRKSPKN